MVVRERHQVGECKESRYRKMLLRVKRSHQVAFATAHLGVWQEERAEGEEAGSWSVLHRVCYMERH